MSKSNLKVALTGGIASGKSYTVEHFVKKCFKYVNLNYKR